MKNANGKQSLEGGTEAPQMPPGGAQIELKYHPPQNPYFQFGPSYIANIQPHPAPLINSSNNK
jgi:hypothetical protein